MTTTIRGNQLNASHVGKKITIHDNGFYVDRTWTLISAIDFQIADGTLKIAELDNGYSRTLDANTMITIHEED